MNHIQSYLLATAALFALVMPGCSNDDETTGSSSDTQTANYSEHEHGGGEHDRDRDDHHGAEGEESGNELALNQAYNETRNGAHLVLRYDAESNSFRGIVENTTIQTLEQVRVEVHLSNGKELGPTTPEDLEPGERRDVELAATDEEFDGWTAHPEVGKGEHGHGQGDSEHGREGREEHKEGDTD